MPKAIIFPITCCLMLAAFAFGQAIKVNVKEGNSAAGTDVAPGTADESAQTSAAPAGTLSEDQPFAEAPAARPVAGEERFTFQWLVSEENISRIRLAELRDTDSVVVRFRKGMLDRFINMMKGRDEFERPGFEQTFRSWPPVQQVLYILGKTGPEDAEIRNGISIKSDPRFMTDFRNRVWPLMANYCGSTSCHGGPQPLGGLKLLKVAGKNTRVDYTNFLILDSFSKGGRKMIDRDRKDMSLILRSP